MTDAIEPLSGEAAASVPVNPDLRWYIVHAYSGMEKAVERNITERINRAGMQDKFGRILVPTEEVVEMKNGQRKTTERRLFPGYVFVEMVMDDDTWHLVKHTSKVTGFVGGAKNRPAPISEAEVQKIVSQMEEGSEKPRHKIEFMVGELVRVLHPLNSSSLRSKRPEVRFWPRVLKYWGFNPGEPGRLTWRYYP